MVLIRLFVHSHPIQLLINLTELARTSHNAPMQILTLLLVELTRVANGINLEQPHLVYPTPVTPLLQVQIANQFLALMLKASLSALYKTASVHLEIQEP